MGFFTLFRGKYAYPVLRLGSLNGELCQVGFVLFFHLRLGLFSAWDPNSEDETTSYSPGIGVPSPEQMDYRGRIDGRSLVIKN